jgi:quercetin dioxygenase-like cupin family protein
MSSFGMWVSSGVAILCAAVLGSHVASFELPRVASHPGTKERARVALSQVLPKLDGDHLKATVVEVNYGPGESSPPHSHPCAVIGYVAEGALRTQVRGNPEAIYQAGESFYEAPNGVHAVSANASQTKPAKLIAYFVCDHDAPLSVDVPETTKLGGK